MPPKDKDVKLVFWLAIALAVGLIIFGLTVAIIKN
jgi:hypothetical protein